MFPIPFNFPFRKKDGSVTTIDAAISGGGTPYTLPTASAETKGGVKIGSGLSMSGETLNNSNPTPYTLPTASAETKGGVKIGSGLSIDENGVLSASGGGGGGSNHIHFITIKQASEDLVQLIIVNDSTTAFADIAALNTWLENNGHGTTDTHGYPVYGKSAVYPAIGVRSGGANNMITFVKFVTNEIQYQTLAGNTLTDVVI